MCMAREATITTIRALFLGALLLAPCSAEVAIEELKVRMQGQDVNIRVSIRNPGRQTQAGPIMIDLYVRDDAGSPWQLIKTWNDLPKLQAGYRVSRDFFEENNALLRALAADKQFDAKAVIRLPGGVKDVEAVRALEQTPPNY